MTSLSPSRLISTYLEALKTGFHAGVAPDGTAVLSTPFRLLTGDPLEIALWEEGGHLVLSDRGGLVNALLASGVDAIGSEACREHIRSAAEEHGGRLEGGTVVRPALELGPGAAVQALVQSVMDAQAAAQRGHRRGEPVEEPETYAAVREALDRGEARYREDMHVSGRLGRRYPVDFLFAVRGKEVTRGILVVARDRTVEFAERWNFRLRDIRAARPRLQRVVVVDDGAPWSTYAHRVIEPECEAVFPPGEAARLGDYLRQARAAA